MASKTLRHACRPRIISHYEDFSRVLTMCAQTDCNKTEVIKQGKVKVAERKYRAETDEEWKARWSALVHLCCQ